MKNTITQFRKEMNRIWNYCLQCIRKEWYSVRKEGHEILIVAGMPGAKKDLIISNVLESLDDVSLAPCCTNRANSESGENEKYYFLSKAMFQKKKSENAFIETSRDHKDSYAIARSTIEEMKLKGVRTILIDSRSNKITLALKLRYPAASTVFVLPEQPDSMLAELRAHCQSKEELRHAYRRVLKQIDSSRSYDYVIINHDVNQSAEALKQIISFLRLRSDVQEQALDEVIGHFYANDGY